MSPPPAVQRETVGLVVVAILVRLLALVRLILLRLLPAGDEGRQPFDIAFGGGVAVLGTLRLMLLLLRKGLCVARDVRLRLARTIR
jgi:hypothetical protein